MEDDSLLYPLQRVHIRERGTTAHEQSTTWKKMFWGKR